MPLSAGIITRERPTVVFERALQVGGAKVGEGASAEQLPDKAAQAVQRGFNAATTLQQKPPMQ